MFLFTSLSTAVYSSCALALAALVRLLFSTVFLSLLVSSLWMVSAEIHSLCWVFFLPRTSSHVSCQSFLQCSHCVSMSVSLSSVSSCSGWNLLERLIWKAACVSLSLSSPTLYFVRVLLAVVNLLRRSFTVIIRRWWSDDTSAPLITRTSCHDLLNLRLMHMWSIWFSVTWFGDIHVAVWMHLCGKMLPPITSWFRVHRSAKRSPFSFICPSPCVPMMSSYPVLSIPILALKSPISMVMSFVPLLSSTACSCW